MSKKWLKGESNLPWNNLNYFIGKKILKVEEGGCGIDIYFNDVVCQVYWEGSYSDWWENFVKFNKKNTNVIHKVFLEERGDKITVTFVDESNKLILQLIHVFHNDSDWDYGCYVTYDWNIKGHKRKDERIQTFYA